MQTALSLNRDILIGIYTLGNRLLSFSSLQVLITIYWLGRRAQCDQSYDGPYLNFKAFEGLLGTALYKVIHLKWAIIPLDTVNSTARKQMHFLSHVNPKYHKRNPLAHVYVCIPYGI